MVKKRKKIAVSFLWLLMLLTMTSCSAEELLKEIPETAQLVEQEQPDGQEQVVEQEQPDGQEQAVEQEQPDGQEQVVGQEQVTESSSESSFLSEAVYPYAYHTLSAEKKLWYEDIAEALGSMQETVRLSEEGLKAGLDESCIDTIFQCVLNDHPELFYVSGYTYTKYSRGEEVVEISFSGTYDLSKEAASARMQEIEQAADAVLAGIDVNASEYDKAKYVYENIVRNTDYDLNAPDNQNIYSVFVGKRSVCQGYAKAAQYLLNRLGMECTLVQGSVENGQSHAWNLIRVDGSYYYMDVTWGDASYQSMDGTEIEGQQLPEINYDYLCITTEQLLNTHKLANCVPLPECVDTAANYYVRQGTFFETYDTEQLKAVFDKALGSGGEDITIKCANAACFQEMKTALIDKQEIFDYLSDGALQIAYACNEAQLSLSFWMTNQ